MKPVPGILEISPYVGGRSSLGGTDRVFKLSSNEQPLGPSPRAIEAFSAASASMHLYPDGNAMALREAIASHWGLKADRIMCGNGSGEILQLLAQIYAGVGDEVLYSAHGFLLYRIAALAASATPIVAPEKNLTTDIDELLRRVTARTKIVFVTNPNNPTGSYNTKAELNRFRQNLPAETLLVIDAAYAEYVDQADFDSGLEMAASLPNTIMTRTFSKIFGLAALRVGWAVGPADVIDALNRVRGPFNVSTPAQAAAIAALGDKEHTNKVKAHNTYWRNWLFERLNAMGLKCYPSQGNFLLIEFAHTGAKTAKEADQFLSKHGVILRAVTAYGLPHHLRITVGSDEANRKAVSVLEEFMK